MEGGKTLSPVTFANSPFRGRDEGYLEVPGVVDSVRTLVGLSSLQFVNYAVRPSFYLCSILSEGRELME